MMKGEKEKKEKRQIAQLLWAKGIAICNISVDCSIELSGMVDDFFFFLIPFYYSWRQKRSNLRNHFTNFLITS